MREKISSTRGILGEPPSPHVSRPEAPGEHLPARLYTLLGWRLTALEINPKSIERHSPDLLVVLRRRCVLCSSKGKCLEDMMDFRHTPGWEDYCPNAEAIAALVTDPRFCLRKNIPIGDRSQSL